MHKTIKVSLILLAILLSGCAQSPKPLYHWDGYQNSIYQYYQQTESSPQEQIIVLQKNIEQAKAQNVAVAPGLHAHLGLLYVNVGQIDLAYSEFNLEKSLYPESTKYMDFLLSNNKGIKK
ncbi:DUF4810 domain-containing protein [Moellerella wisconsensis]|uniref:Putative lipoprotein n=1 Tax=Moellerella wisconsensis ATCC 35017 TaxID=1354267 RepID=A0A0N0IBY7_9GAMM|nr:DUF4810 domain-containing protein [Moellerella wisconsensis]KPD04021.1 putative lipoprotein [Moellerella wisconsensis ATCC 35017]VFS49941.1 Uncharacterised protein [Moellerella wisconsensis]